MDYTKRLEILEERLLLRSGERAGFNKQIDSVLQVIELVKKHAHEELEVYDILLPGHNPGAKVGFTNRVRNIFKANLLKTLNPVSIRDALLEFDMESDPKITLIHTHNTVKRLRRHGEILHVCDDAGALVGYTWVSEPTLSVNHKGLTVKRADNTRDTHVVGRKCKRRRSVDRGVKSSDYRCPL